MLTFKSMSFQIWKMNEPHMSVFHSVSNRAHEKRSRNSLFRCSVRFQLVFFSNKRLYDIHVTWFDWFLRREGDSALHLKKRSFMFSQQLAKFKNETKIKTYLRAKGAPWCFGVCKTWNAATIFFMIKFWQPQLPFLNCKFIFFFTAWKLHFKHFW